MTAADKNLPPAITEVFTQFISSLRSDEKIDKDAVTNLENLLASGSVPKPDEIHSAIFPVKGEDL